jgi:hypothetical protein
MQRVHSVLHFPFHLSYLLFRGLLILKKGFINWGMESERSEQEFYVLAVSMHLFTIAPPCHALAFSPRAKKLSGHP